MTGTKTETKTGTDTTRGGGAQAGNGNRPPLNDLPRGWAYNSRIFHIDANQDGFITALCQKTVWTKEQEEQTACAKRARYARTLWSGNVVFSCGRHLDDIEEFARPLIAMGSRGPAVIRPIMLEAPHHLSVPGAAEPVEHPVHIGLKLETEDGRVECRCGATTRENEHGITVWDGGKPLDTPWWQH